MLSNKGLGLKLADTLYDKIRRTLIQVVDLGPEHLI